jgi:hypothetical protein
MALSANTLIEVEQAASDTNGGGFNPSNANFAADLAAQSSSGNTASPVVSSASYNFAAGDVGAHLWIKSGTNWLPGLYPIASVASNQATLSAAIGQAITFTGYVPTGTNTVAGCASTASPTAGVWGIDYTQQTAAEIAVTDAVTAGTTTIVSATAAFSKAHIGNLIYVAGGTGSVVGAWYEVASVTNSTTIVVDRSTGLTTGTGATLNLGGALATIGGLGSMMVASNQAFLQYSATNYQITATSGSGATGTATVSGGTVTAVTLTGGGSGYVSPAGIPSGAAVAITFTGGGGTGATAHVGVVTGACSGAITVEQGGSGYGTTPTPVFLPQINYNVSGGAFLSPGGAAATPGRLVGYATNRHINNLDVNRPYILAVASGGFMINPANAAQNFQYINLIVDGNCPTNTWICPIGGGQADTRAINCKATNFDNRGFQTTTECLACEATNAIVHSFFEGVIPIFCVARAVTNANFGCAGYDTCASPQHCLADNCGFGFNLGQDISPVIGCVAINNAANPGFQTAAGRGGTYVNCISWGNKQDWNLTASCNMINCATGYGSDGASADALGQFVLNLIKLTVNPFNNSSSGPPFDFGLNNTAGGGALLRGAGYPGNLGAWLAGQVSYGTGVADVGTLQHAASGGGSTYIFQAEC